MSETGQSEIVRFGVGKFIRDVHGKHVDVMMRVYDRLTPKHEGKAREIATHLRPTVEKVAKVEAGFAMYNEAMLAAMAAVGVVLVGKKFTVRLLEKATRSPKSPQSPTIPDDVSGYQGYFSPSSAPDARGASLDGLANIPTLSGDPYDYLTNEQKIVTNSHISSKTPNTEAELAAIQDDPDEFKAGDGKKGKIRKREQPVKGGGVEERFVGVKRSSGEKPKRPTRGSNMLVDTTPNDDGNQPLSVATDDQPEPPSPTRTPMNADEKAKHAQWSRELQEAQEAEEDLMRGVRVLREGEEAQEYEGGAMAAAFENAQEAAEERAKKAASKPPPDEPPTTQLITLEQPAPQESEVLSSRPPRPHKSPSSKPSDRQKTTAEQVASRKRRKRAESRAAAAKLRADQAAVLQEAEQRASEATARQKALERQARIDTANTIKAAVAHFDQEREELGIPDTMRKPFQTASARFTLALSKGENFDQQTFSRFLEEESAGLGNTAPDAATAELLFEVYKDSMKKP